MLKTSKIGVVMLLTAAMLGAGVGEAKAQNASPLGIHDVIESVDIIGGALVARTTQGQLLVIGFTAHRQPRTPCPILNLELGPINLDLLGLVVETSPICLDITAVPGRGNLLGNLLCSVARLLDQGLPLDQILGGLTVQQANLLTSGLQDILNIALNQLNNAVVTDNTNSQLGCPILDLELGPLELNVLGLLVELDDCMGGPVTVEVTAVPGALLGDLLCGLLGGIDLGGTLQDLLQDILDGILGAL